jgi:hypothetical protein
MSNARRLPLLAVGLTLILGACRPTGGPAASPTGQTPAASPEASPKTNAGFDHPTGPSDVVLRYEEGGGFVMAEFAVTQAPVFTLYGDGTIVFRDPAAEAAPDENGFLAFQPFRTARLSEEQIQSLLAFAINDGGLGVAKARYDHPGVADAGTATFTINAGGQSKTVEVYALGLEGTPDQVVRAKFLALAERLKGFDQGGTIPTDEYTPHGWRAILVDAQGAAAPAQAWPWPDLTPADFVAVADEPPLPSFPFRVLTADEIAALGLGELKGGLMGYYLKGPDGKIYNLPIRPLLPDEER